MSKPIAWTIAGSDSSAGAGIQTDLQVFHHLGVQGASVITAITAQNSKKIIATYYVPKDQISAQISAITSELSPQAVKIGMLGSRDAIESVAAFLKDFSGQVVLDPVLHTSGGGALVNADLRNYIKLLANIFPYLTLITPNIPEAETLAKMSIASYEDMQIAAEKILKIGVKNVLIKGGHFLNDNMSQDYWTNGSESFWLVNPRLDKNCRGTGCVFSSGVTAALALGYALKDALVIAKMYVNRGIRLAENHYAFHGTCLEDGIDLPYLSHQPLFKIVPSFPNCGTDFLGLYPIVDSSLWLKKLLPLGVKTIQLRIKNKTGETLKQEIKESIALAKAYNVRLFINDYWELALEYGAYGVHLGQEDLHTADIEKIYQAGMRLGVSTHCYYEVARAHSLHPSYLACGPVFETTSKIMSFAPQGICNLKRWVKTVNNYPWVAIGGIGAAKIADVLATGVSGIAIISAITKASDPIAQTTQFLQLMNNQLCKVN